MKISSSPINLIIPIIINYQLGIERSSLVSINLPGAHALPGDIKKTLFLLPLPLSQVADCETTRAIGWVTL